VPLAVAHLRRNVKLPATNPAAWDEIDHQYNWDLLFAMSHLIEEDGGPKCPHGSGYGIYARRVEVDHTFSLDYPLPDGEGVKRGDRIRMWRESK